MAVVNPTTPPSARKRCEMDLNQMMEHFAPFVRATGSSFIKYPETAKREDCPIESKAILAHLDFLELAHRAQENLSFTRTQVEAFLEVIIGEKGHVWEMSKKIWPEWVETLTRRWLNICHCTQKAATKKVPPSWTAALPWMLTDSALPETQPLMLEDAADAGDTAADAVEILWSDQTKTAYAKDAAGKIEFANPPRWEDLEGTNPHDTYIATWPDGAEGEVPGVLNTYVREILSSGQKEGAGNIWSGETADLKTKVIVRQRSGGPQLLM